MRCARSNLITRDGSKALARALQTNTSLELLDLGNTRLEDEGAQNLAACLTGRNRTLRTCAASLNHSLSLTHTLLSSFSIGATCIMTFGIMISGICIMAA